MPLLEADNLAKSFGPTSVLDGVSIAVHEGEVVCIVGPSGSGKTTLLRCLALLEPPTAGEIRLRGQCVASPRPDRATRAEARRIRPAIGMVFQHFNLWPHMTVLANVAEAPRRVKGLPRPAAEALARQHLDRVGMIDKAAAFPAQLSGGQQQRVAIARALATSPDVILFDEPTSALDPELKREVLVVMRNLAAEGATMVVVTHEMHFASRAASRIVFMDHGRIVEDTTPDIFFSNPASARARSFLELLMEQA
jgi:ABC-type polar amino acid transport system ATPase subunit